MLSKATVFIALTFLFFPTENFVLDFASDLETWMTNLPEKHRTAPIIHLAIPGSHDSGTYAITNTSDISPDADEILKDLSFLGPLLKEVMSKWSLTQNYNIEQQLVSGIRYFDFRIATKEDTNEFYFVHGLYSAEISKDLIEINKFLTTHPKEIVILDCQHFYGLNSNDHQRFQTLLIDVFGQKLTPYKNNIMDFSLNSMANNNYQVIVIYREISNLNEKFWPSDTLPNPWANTVSVSELINFLDKELKNRDYSIGYVSQCVLTPDTNMILTHLGSDLETECFLPLEESKYNWLHNQKPGIGGINVVISDFVDFNDNEFAKAIINLNKNY